MKPFVAERRRANIDAMLWLKRRAAVLVPLVGIADFLFYDSPAAGLPVAVFIILIAIAALTFNRLRSSKNWRLVAGAMLAASIAALVVDADLLSVPFAAALSAASIVLLVQGAVGWMGIAGATALLPLVGLPRLAADLLRAKKAIARRGRCHFAASEWVMPVGLSLFFLAVFIVANPVIERWADLLNPDHLMPIDVERTTFWAAAVLLLWPFLHLGRSRQYGKWLPSLPPGGGRLSGFLNDSAIRRSLVSFNLLFAAQTVTDLGYLWGGMDLPDGMTHAEYAHRGAYPLMAAALVAAAFVLVALRSGSEGAPRRALKLPLVVFVAQGVLLVASSMLRLDLYVEAYSLTLWRVAAFIWMGLVAFGFVTILIRILAEYSTHWLVNVNACTAVFVLWICCFVDFAGLVTDFNIVHSREATGAGPAFDLNYVVSAFGARVIPALDAHRDVLGGRGKQWVVCAGGACFDGTLDQWRDQTAAETIANRDDWRTWSFADWRLKRYLSEAPQWTVPQSR